MKELRPLSLRPLLLHFSGKTSARTATDTTLQMVEKKMCHFLRFLTAR